MPEGNINAEVSQHLREHNHGHGEVPSHRRLEIIEIAEAVLLAFVALTTALSGYQAARWDGESARAYAESSRLRAESNETALAANQVLAYDAATFTAWLQAYEADDQQLVMMLERRFTPEYEAAFRAWLKLEPFSNPKAPPGPAYMPTFRNAEQEEAKAYADEATAAFEEGVTSRATAEHYVRVTVILAAVLFLLAIGQRFHIRGVRRGLAGVAAVFLAYCIVLIATYPHT